jgi:hypothetical protein
MVPSLALNHLEFLDLFPPVVDGTIPTNFRDNPPPTSTDIPPLKRPDQLRVQLPLLIL